MNLEARFIAITQLLKEHLPLFSQWDKDVLQGNKYEHEWIKRAQSLSPDELARFDALREYKLLRCEKWEKLVYKMDKLTNFEQQPTTPNSLVTVGNLKKQHELNQLYHLLQEDRNERALDFGGGVGNLASFLNTNLAMNVDILEQDELLIKKGLAKFSEQKEKMRFIHTQVTNTPLDLKSLDSDLALGLHTCGEFACNMLRICKENQIKKIVNFGCCYSKIKNDDYNISSFSDKELYLNQRALTTATLSFTPVPLEFFEFRKIIRNYKFSFYHWLYKKHNLIEFCSMSNARRSLYKLDFEQFALNTYHKYFSNLELPTESELKSFYISKENKDFNHYLAAYYAISRYFGKLIEVYLICDRALYLKENGYNVEIKEIFDEKISPRNKAIIARRK